MMLEFMHPIPLTADGKKGFAIYVTDSGMFENDVWCVVHTDGSVRHYSSRQLTMDMNGTFGIFPDTNK